ncbi:MFS transporter [Limnofasciculus baicalensis]|uniref:MFS transporter n=1 Tax=Limnofasciculus baicalensis BBK-W-15 TaxID=2699891 RepID=A0AAE3KQE4_9CYAN|nr:MFS transporter [Limnofasciculus baicalensis]MCP2730618.1 MFS transporter [Limnofasciculus baicalensis BBK-W-15]
MLSLNRYQWTILFAAWLGWGFDIFDALLFNFVAPNCIPTLLGLTIGSPEAETATFFWTGLLTSILLLGWAAGGVFFGQVADRIGRTKTLIITMLLYAFGTASCALVPNIWVLILCRIITSLGIGGEWAAGTAMVAEAVPEKSRLEAAILLQTAAPMGIFLATFVNFQIAGVIFLDNPETSWRYVFLFGLIPAAIALLVRWFIDEPEAWQKTSNTTLPPKLSELFNTENLPSTLSGVVLSLTALLTWWSVSAFLPVTSSSLAHFAAEIKGLDGNSTLMLEEKWKAMTSIIFNFGCLIGIFLTVPIAKYLGRKMMFALYFIASAASILITFGLDLPPEIRMYLYLPMGIWVAGIFGSFSFYLPELFPTRIRATGAGFCYNIGRIVAAGGPFLVGSVASQGTNALNSALTTQFWFGFVPLLGLCFIPWVIETKGRVLVD